MSLPPEPTLGPIVDPSIGIDRTPTPIPVITMGPTPTASPTALPSPTRKPTPKPTTKPSAVPSAAVTPAPPTAAFSWSPVSPTVGESVLFSNTSTGGSSYAWDFGDGGTSTAAEPSHAYLVPDTYTVMLTVTGPGGSDVVTHAVTVTVLPS